jgi:predicted Zn-dependent protease
VATLAAAAFAAGCATSPLGRPQFTIASDQQLAQAGAQAFRQVEQKTPASGNAQEVKFVSCVAYAVTAAIPNNDTPWQVRVFDSKEINAFALPGGHIGVYTGLLRIATTQDELAAVIGHEVSHVIAHHANERYSQQMAASLGAAVVSVATGVDPNAAGEAANLALLVGGFTREQETEADLLGLDLMSRAGFDPRAAVELWRKMENAGGKQPPELLSTHPSDAHRITRLEQRLPRDVPIYEQARAAGRRPHCG